MVETGAGPKKRFRQVEQIHIVDTHYQARGYFGMLCIGNVGNNVLPNPLAVSYLQNISGGTHKVKHFYDRVHSYMIVRSIEGSIKIYILRNLGFIEGYINGLPLGVS